MSGVITIRQATEADRANLLRLAALDEAPVPQIPALLGFIDDELVAALPADGGRAIADPFRRTGDLVALLRAYASRRNGHGAHARLRFLNTRLSDAAHAA